MCPVSEVLSDTKTRLWYRGLKMSPEFTSEERRKCIQGPGSGVVVKIFIEKMKT